ncbi:MAG: hypothetical protein V6D39_18335 [Dolichospermum lemmermannii FEM_B0920]
MSSESKSPFQQIAERCQEANIDIAQYNQENIDHGFLIKLKSGEDTVFIRVSDESRAKLLLEDDIHFEKVNCISGYYAYYSIEYQYIEAILECEYGGMLLNHYQLYESEESIIKQKITNQEANKRSIIKINNDQNVKFSVGLSTPTVSTLTTIRECDIWPIFRGERIDYTTIRIEQVPISSHEQALEILEKLADSLLFELTHLTGLPILLATIKYGNNKEISIEKKEVNLERQYDEKPMDLYLYANTAAIMPLVQYLAYYQVIEFYFPTFQKKEAEKIIQIELQNLSFHDDTYTGMKGLIKKVEKFMPKSVYGNEIDALKATINNCLNMEEIKNFFEKDEDRRNFFHNNSEITSEKIPRNDENGFLSNTAKRIYRIRCKIVHTKDLDSADEEKESILPFSKEAQKLGYDIELVKFIARKVLEHCSKPLEI